MVLLLNYVFNEMMDESGLHVVIVTGTLPRSRLGPVDVSNFRAHAARLGDEAVAANSKLLRSELLQYKSVGGVEGVAAPYAFVRVHRHPMSASEAVAAAAAAGVESDATPPQVLRTIFPESGRWRQARPTPEEGMHSMVGFLELLAQHTTITVPESGVAAFKRGWTDLGYNALGEPGVVRCDLMQDASQPTRFVARKVFRGAHALMAHEESDHYLRWRHELLAHEGTDQLSIRVETAELLNTIHPRSAPQPFQTAWKTI